jgi:hypothetical protein
MVRRRFFSAVASHEAHLATKSPASSFETRAKSALLRMRPRADPVSILPDASPYRQRRPSAEIHTFLTRLN